MDMGGMHMMDHHDMAQMPCSHCDQEEEEVALCNPTFKTFASTQIQYANVFSSPNYPTSAYKHPSGLPLANAGPPPLSQLLVGTVILRT